MKSNLLTKLSLFYNETLVVMQVLNGNPAQAGGDRRSAQAHLKHHQL